MNDQFLYALAVTVSIETTVLVVLLKYAFTARQHSLPRVVFTGLLASSWSLPYFWFLVPRFIDGPAYVPVGELLVTLGEAIIFRMVLELPLLTSLVISALCNVSSFLVGSILRGLY